jgi:hypothetical protein
MLKQAVTSGAIDAILPTRFFSPIGGTTLALRRGNVANSGEPDACIQPAMPLRSINLDFGDED